MGYTGRADAEPEAALVTVKQAAARLEVHTSTVYRLVGSGQLEATAIRTKPGRRATYRITERAIAEYEAAAKVQFRFQAAASDELLEAARPREIQ